MLKEFLQAKNKRMQVEITELGYENLPGKGKQKIKVGNNPHTKLIGKFKDRGIKIMYIYNRELSDTQNN